MEGLMWSIGVLLVGVVGVTVFTLLEIRRAKQWLYEAKELAPAKQLAKIQTFMTTLQSEFGTLLQENDEKHDRWKREQASLRTYIHRRLGKEDPSESAPGSTAIPERITAEEAAQLGAQPGAQIPEDGRVATRRAIKAAWHAARGTGQ